jgi:hypothetical protein
MSKVLNSTVLLTGSPDDVTLAEHRPGYQTLQIGSALTLHLDMAPADLLRAIGAAFYEAADEKNEAAIVALNTPATPIVDASVPTMCVPDWGSGAKAS